MVVEASRAVWAAWALFVVGAMAGAATSVGCSASSPGTAQVADGAATVCPATIDQTVGQKCSAEGLKCGPTYSCGATQVPIYCTCFEGAFRCVDGSGKTFDGTTPPSCAAGGSAGGVCPSSESEATTATCSEAQSGMQCAYAPKCPGGTLTFDVCTCSKWFDSSGNLSWVYVCDNSCSGGSGPVPEAGASSSGSGSGSGSEPQPEAGSGDGATE
jgi:hypothetical protein